MVRAFEGLRHSGVPISEESAQIAGITDDMMSGKFIDGVVVTYAVEDADLVIAHNAAFDRVMVEQHWPCFGDKPWARTLDAIESLAELLKARPETIERISLRGLLAEGTVEPIRGLPENELRANFSGIGGNMHRPAHS